MGQVHLETLRKAAAILGGAEQLGRELDVAPSQILRWLTGMEHPPGDVFLRAVDIVTEHSFIKLLPPKGLEPDKSE
jgi:hypothetical protein